MDNTGDDQGSGWFEVKKKHRSSSKLSIQNWVGGFSRQQVNGKGGNSNDKHGSHLPKPAKNIVKGGVASHSSPKEEIFQRGLDSHSSPKGETKKDERCSDKCVVDDGNGNLETPPLKIISTTSSESTSTIIKNVPENKADVVHKINWGDLQDDTELDHGTSAVEIRFGEIGDDDLAICGTSSKLFDPVSCNSSQGDPVVSKNVVEVGHPAGDTCHKSSPSPIKESLEESYREICEVASTDVASTSANIKTVDSEISELDHSKFTDDEIEHVKKGSLCAIEPSDGKVQCPSNKEPAKTVELSTPVLTAEVDHTCSPAVGAVEIVQDSGLASEQSLPEASGNPNTMTLGDSGDNNSSKAPIMSAITEPEVGESKERFRERLWCFLFENLNRAMDELYLLCELECDLDQVKEAILVLQEAESDFRELNIRVKEFEKMKKNSSQSATGTVVSMKGDYRRPHALSWEVRRMTTSPHRAEILSSSLEAFKKIQEERAKERATGDNSAVGPQHHTYLPVSTDDAHSGSPNPATSDLETKSRRQSGISDPGSVNLSRERRSRESRRASKVSSAQSVRTPPPSSASSDPNTTKLPPKGTSSSLGGKGKRESLGSSADGEKLSSLGELLKRHNAASDKDKEKDRRNSMPWKPVDAWKEKRNWEEILASPSRLSSRLSYSPCMSRRSAERARILHDKLMSPEKKKKTSVDLKKEAEEKAARAMRIRSELEKERVQKLQRTSEKLNRVSEYHAVRSMKLREGMHARHQRSESRHEAHIAQVVKRAGDESIKVNEVRFITSLNEENKKFWLHQKHRDSETRRAEKIQVMKTKQKEDMAREEAVLERRKLIEAEKLQRLAETQRRKEEALLRREEERKASSAAREARTMEQLRRKKERAKAQQEEAELLAQRLAERLSESEQRRKVYLEQIRERASMDFRDQSSPLMRRLVNKESQGRSTQPGNADDSQVNSSSAVGDAGPANNSAAMQQSLKRRIKKTRQRLMALKHDVPETMPVENISIGYRTAMGTARAKIGKWLQDLQKLRQQRKEGASRIGLIAAEMIKFLEGKDLELLAARQAGMLDFIASALPASHISKPEACQVTLYLLRLLKVILFTPTNRSYFLSQNLLPPLIPMLSAVLESYIKNAASLNGPCSSSLQPSKTSIENFDSISEVLDGFLWTVTMIIALPTLDERQLQMQDGLLELVVSYQIIHRLRDLFALYDRPQIEGSPFPSSILLSINLLVVLTSRPCIGSSVDWEFLPDWVIRERESERPNLVDDVQRDELCGESHKTRVLDDSTCFEGQGEKEQLNNPIELNSKSTETGDDLCDSQKDMGSCNPDSALSQKDEQNTADTGVGIKKEHMSVKQPLAFLLSAVSETGLVSLPSLLTAVLLQANNRLSSEQGSYVLPSNFEEVATGVLKVLNNLALMDIAFMQQMLARPDLKMEFFHIMSFLLTHCTNNWKGATDQVGLLLLESLPLLGYFSLLHPGNQAVLRWGSTPTILHKVCDLPFAFFSDPELMPILAGTLVASCFGCEQNKGVVQQELSTEMILSVVKSCRSSLPTVRSVEDSTESTLLPAEPRKPHPDVLVKPTRSSTAKSSRLSLSKGGALTSKIGKFRNPSKDSKTGRIIEDPTLKLKKAASPETPATLPLYSRFPGSFVDRAEQFFSVEPSSIGGY